MIDYKTKIAELSSESGRLYLIERINSDSGIFLFDKHVSFGKMSSARNNNAISTSLLDYQPNLPIEAVANDSSFPTGLYDFLILKENKDEDVVNSFIDVVTLYGKNPSMPFDDFIYSIIELFQLPKKQTELDYIGLYGELIFIKDVWLKHKKNLAPFWHLSGVYSKYDFSSPNVNIEIKTTPTDSTSFLIKHSQLFNGDNNFVVLVKIFPEETMGQSLEDLVTYFRHTEPFSSDVRFQMALMKELTKKIGKDPYSKHFKLKDAYSFKTDLIPTIENIPICISEVSYRYSFDVSSSLPIPIVLDLIK